MDTIETTLYLLTHFNQLCQMFSIFWQWWGYQLVKCGCVVYIYIVRQIQRSVCYYINKDDTIYIYIYTWEPKVAKIKHTRNENGQNFTHQNKTTLFWIKKAKINLHQNFPIYGSPILWYRVYSHAISTNFRHHFFNITTMLP